MAVLKPAVTFVRLPRRGNGVCVGEVATMDTEHERRVLMQKLSWSRAEIVRLASAWQASGLDTAALGQPLGAPPEALTNLESPASPEQRVKTASVGGAGSHHPGGALT